MVRDTLTTLVSGPAGQMDPAAVLSAYQAADGPQITERPAPGKGRWLEFEDTTGDRWGRRVGWYDQHNDRIWVDLNEYPEQGWRVQWHETAHSTGASGRLARTDFVALQNGLNGWSDAAELKNAREEITAECGSVLLGRQTGTLTEAQLDASEDVVVGQAWISPVALDPPGLERLLSASAADAAEAASFVLEPSRQATAATADIEAGA
jgi:antirestriction protein ArdC